MKFIALLTAAHVGGVLRHPHEGVLHVPDEEADRLIKVEAATDVTDDFSDKENKAAPVEHIAAEGAGTEHADPSEPHQSEVAPQSAEVTKPAGRKAAASKE